MRYTKAKYIQLIHIAKHKLSIDESTYRSLLMNLTGKSTCKQMKVTELDKVLSALETKGFQNNAASFHKNSYFKLSQSKFRKSRSQTRYCFKNSSCLD